MMRQLHLHAVPRPLRSAHRTAFRCKAEWRSEVVRAERRRHWVDGEEAMWWAGRGRAETEFDYP